MAKNDLTEIENAPAPALMDSMEGEAGAGLENTSADDYAVPFISILQKNSPQCDEDSDSYVDGAKPGLFWDSGAMAVLSDEGAVPMETIAVTPIHYERRFNQWKDREEGGGFVASHPHDADIVATATRDERGRLQLHDGTYLADTRQFFCMLYNADRSSARPALISMSSTQIKAGRQWLTRMSDFKIDGKNGRFNPPIYGQVWNLSTVSQSNAKGSWRGWRIGEPELVSDPDIFEAAKSFREAIVSGDVQVSAPASGETATEADNSPPF